MAHSHMPSCGLQLRPSISNSSTKTAKQLAALRHGQSFYSRFENAYPGGGSSLLLEDQEEFSPGGVCEVKAGSRRGKRENVVLNFTKEYRAHQTAMEKLQILSPLKNDAEIAFCKLFGGEKNQQAAEQMY